MFLGPVGSVKYFWYFYMSTSYLNLAHLRFCVLTGFQMPVLEHGLRKRRTYSPHFDYTHTL